MEGTRKKSNQEVVQLWRAKQRIVEETTEELQSALQTKDEQMLKLTQTISSMLGRVESLQTQIAHLKCRFLTLRAYVIFWFS